jgi:hypothetical protein
MTALYEQDLHAWSLDQAERLRHARDSGSNLDLDWDHLIEEVEALAGSQRRALTSNLMRVLEHLAKLRYSAALRPRAGWERSVASHRAEIELLLEQSPSLANLLPDMMPRAWTLARRLASRSLTRDPGSPTLPEDCPFELDRVLNPDWYPEPSARH